MITKAALTLLKILVCLVGLIAIVFLLWEPHFEGRNLHATVKEIYFNDPFLIFAYIASIPFFIILIHIFRLLGFAGNNTIFSDETLQSVQLIKKCAVIMIGFVAVGEIIILLNESDDRVGGFVIGFLIAFASVVIASAAVIFEKIIQTGLDIKSNKQ